jgi:hypothetical protein
MLNKAIKENMIQVCDRKIKTKGENVGASFYAFFANENLNLESLMRVATWWIKIHKLDHLRKR